MFNLDGKVALVTGASRGIGRAIAARLAEQGATVVAVARGDHAAEGVAALTARGLKAEALGVDVTDADALEASRAGARRARAELTWDAAAAAHLSRVVDDAAKLVD